MVSCHSALRRMSSSLNLLHFTSISPTSEVKLCRARPQQIDSSFQKKGLSCKISCIGSFCMLWSVGRTVGTCRFMSLAKLGNYSKIPKRLTVKMATLCWKKWSLPSKGHQKNHQFHSQATIQRPVLSLTDQLRDSVAKRDEENVDAWRCGWPVRRPIPSLVICDSFVFPAVIAFMTTFVLHVPSYVQSFELHLQPQPCLFLAGWASSL